MITDPKEILQHFRSYFEDFSSSKPILPNTLADLSSMECVSFLNDKKILDGKSGGGDGLDPEHVYYGGEILNVWLKKIFNWIIALEEIPVCLKEGVIKGRVKTLSRWKTIVGSPSPLW